MGAMEHGRGGKTCGGGPRHVVGARDALVGRQVMQMGAMEDGRCERGPEGMGWGQGCVGWGWDVCEGVGTCVRGLGHV